MCSRSSLPLVTRLTFQIYFHSRNCQYQQPIFSSQNQMSRNHKRNLDRMRQSKVFRAKHYIDNNSYFLPIPLLLTRNQYKAKKSIKNNTSKKQARGSQPILSSPKNSKGKISISPVSIPVLPGRKIRKKEDREAAAIPSQDHRPYGKSRQSKWKRPTTSDCRVFCGEFFVCTTLSSRSRCGYCMGSFSFCVRAPLAHSQFLSATGTDDLRL